MRRTCRTSGSPRARAARLFVAVSIKQRYPGHAAPGRRSVATLCYARAYMGRIVVVVDDDIDVYDERASDVGDRHALRPRARRDHRAARLERPARPDHPAERKGFNSRMIIDATRPWEWRDKFPAVVGLSRAEIDAAMAKWGPSCSTPPLARWPTPERATTLGRSASARCWLRRTHRESRVTNYYTQSGSPWKVPRPSQIVDKNIAGRRIQHRDRALLGRIQDTNSFWLAEHVSELGATVSRITIVGDDQGANPRCAAWRIQRARAPF